MGVLHSRAHEALVAVLVMARESTGMTQREVVERLPPWFRISQVTLAKIEKNRRTVAFVEVVALAELYGTDVDTINAQAQAYLRAKSQTTPKKKRGR